MSTKREGPYNTNDNDAAAQQKDIGEMVEERSTAEATIAELREKLAEADQRATNAEYALGIHIPTDIHLEMKAEAISKLLVTVEAERDALLAQNARLRAALKLLYEETAEYIRINHLGDVHHNVSMQRARAALAQKVREEGK